MPGNGKYTEELAQQIADIVAGGTPAKFAAQACGIGESTFYQWLDERQNFRNLLQKRRAQAIQERVDIIRKAATEGKQWTAAAWHLERQHPEEFGIRPEKKDISITVEIRDCTQDRGRLEAAGAVIEAEVVKLIEE